MSYGDNPMVLGDHRMSLPVAARLAGGGQGRRIATDISGARTLVIGNDAPRQIVCEGGDDWPMIQADAEAIRALYGAGLFSFSVPAINLGEPLVGTGALLDPPEFERIGLRPYYRYKFTIHVL